MDVQKLQLEVNVSLWGPPEREGNNDFLSSLSPHSSQGSEPASSHIFIWVWPLKILVETQIMTLGLLVPFEKEGNTYPSPRQECVSTHTFRNGLFTLLTLCAWWGVQALRVCSRHPSAVSHAGSNVPRLRWKTTRRHKTHQKLNSYFFFNVFLKEASSNMYRICLFVFWILKLLCM